MADVARFARGGVEVRMRVRLLVMVLGCAISWACGPGDSEAVAPTWMSLVEALGGADTVGYQRATTHREFVFPADHGPHEGFRAEWWYATGNLADPSGAEFGFQFTIFRTSLAPTPPEGPSEWATNQAWMGHFAVTDIAGERFVAYERFTRGAAGLAGAGAEPFRVWIEDWSLESVESGEGAESVFPLRLRAIGEEAAVDVRLEGGKPRVLQGEEGLSQKGPEPGNASYYYAHTRMPTTGTVTVDGVEYAVSGLTWLDREWSTSALADGQVGWDWFALQLDDGWEMMVYQLRNADGSAGALSDGVLIDPSGARVPLVWGDDVEVIVTGSWTAPDGRARYPAGWRIRVPGRGWDLTVEPAVADQELRLAFRYWEGAVRVTGSGEGGQRVAGRGYVELTGYAGGV